MFFLCAGKTFNLYKKHYPKTALILREHTSLRGKAVR